jgi:hypothetical protein
MVRHSTSCILQGTIPKYICDRSRQKDVGRVKTLLASSLGPSIPSHHDSTSTPKDGSYIFGISMQNRKTAARRRARKGSENITPKNILETDRPPILLPPVVTGRHRAYAEYSHPATRKRPRRHAFEAVAPETNRRALLSWADPIVSLERSLSRFTERMAGTGAPLPTFHVRTIWIRLFCY